MADDPITALESLRLQAGGHHLRDWQVFSLLTERLKAGEAKVSDLVDPIVALATTHPDRHVRRWSLSFLPTLAEYDPQYAEPALAPVLAVLGGDVPDWAELGAIDRQVLWDAAVVGLADLAHRMPALVLPHRDSLLSSKAATRLFGVHPIRKILENLRQGLLLSLRPKAVRSTPKLLDGAPDGACFVILEKDRYHTAHCRHLRRQVRVRLVPLADRSEAETYGFLPCGHCYKVGKDGSVAAKAKRDEDTGALGPMPEAPVIKIARPRLVDPPWSAPEPLPGLDPDLVPPPSVYERLTMMDRNQQRLVGLWLDGALETISDVYRAIYARHHLSQLPSQDPEAASLALERAATGLPADSWCASQVFMASLVAAYMVQDPRRFERILALRPQTIFEYPFLLHCHGQLGAVMTPELLFGLRKLSGTRSSASLKSKWDAFATAARRQLDGFVEGQGCDPVAYALRAGKGRKRTASFGFGKDFLGDVRFLDVLHGLPLATVTGDLLNAALAEFRGPKPTPKIQREHLQRAELEAAHAVRHDAAAAVQALMAQLAPKPGAARMLAEQGLAAFEGGDMIKATAYLHLALREAPDLPAVYARLLDKAANATGYALSTSQH